MTLPYAEAEVAAIVGALGASGLLPGLVTKTQLDTELQKGWDIVWFITHGSKEGIWLSNEIVTASQLIQGVRASGAKLVVLNTCDSYAVAAAIHSELRTYLIATLKPVYDQDAFTTGRLLAAYLGRGESFPSAFNAAIPGRNDSYVYLPGKEEREIVSAPTPTKADTGARYVESAEKLENLVNQISWMLYGVPGVQETGLVQQVKNLEKELEKARNDIRALRWWLFLVTAIVSIVVLTASVYSIVSAFGTT
jgi:hypothetical protein